MSDDITPTDDDLARDLRADLSELEGREGLRYEGYVCNNAPHAWPAAIRRALAAEAEAERLRGLLSDLWHHWDCPHAGSLPRSLARRVCDEIGVEVTDDDGEAD